MKTQSLRSKFFLTFVFASTLLVQTSLHAAVPAGDPESAPLPGDVLPPDHESYPDEGDSFHDVPPPDFGDFLKPGPDDAPVRGRPDYFMPLPRHEETPGHEAPHDEPPPQGW